MQLKKKYWFWLIVTVLCCLQSFAQDTVGKRKTDSVAPARSGPVVTIGEIVISGNKKTKSTIILREIPFRTGEKYTLGTLKKKFEDARRQLMNTTLFNSAVVAVKSMDGTQVTVSVDLKERWYLFPWPYFKPVDRNLNQWIVEQKASLSRVNYGAKILYNNATGHNDKLRLYFITGYTKQFSFSYDRLYIDNKLKWGLSGGFAIGKNREVNYNTINDKQVFLKDNDNYLRSFVTGNAEITYRRAIKTRHRFGISYTKEDVKDTVLSLNPSYFQEGRNNIHYPVLYYNITYYDLDYIPYPTKGYAAQVFLSKKGFNKVINVWELSAKGSASWRLSPKFFFNLNMFGGIRVPFRQPYINRRFFGYGDVFMQGYEYYVVDGVAGGYVKTTLTRELLNFDIRIPYKKGKAPLHIPIKFFGKIYGNTGYVYSPQPGENFLSNKMLYSGGLGIDILTFYDVTFKLEYTFNQLGQNGLFLQRKTIF